MTDTNGYNNNVSPLEADNNEQTINRRRWNFVLFIEVTFDCEQKFLFKNTAMGYEDEEDVRRNRLKLFVEHMRYDENKSIMFLRPSKHVVFI